MWKMKVMGQFQLAIVLIYQINVKHLLFIEFKEILNFSKLFLKE